MIRFPLPPQKVQVRTRQSSRGAVAHGWNSVIIFCLY